MAEGRSLPKGGGEAHSLVLCIMAPKVPFQPANRQVVDLCVLGTPGWAVFCVLLASASLYPGGEVDEIIHRGSKEVQLGHRAALHEQELLTGVKDKSVMARASRTKPYI